MNSPACVHDERRLFSWLSHLLDPARFDVVVSVERKATAVLRALLDLTPEIPCAWTWTRVLSSDALPYLPQNQLAGKRVLVFNEMIHKGRSTLEAINAIRRNSPGCEAQISTAAFFVHEAFDETCSRRMAAYRGDNRGDAPDYAIHRQVSDDLYVILRSRLIELLRDKGALLLDTEHLESTFTYTISHRRFFQALQTFGQPIEYQPDGDQASWAITVSDPAVPLDTLPQGCFPKGCDFESRSPRKVRVVRRGPKEFAFIPIWYPPVPVASVLRVEDWQAPAYARAALANCPAGALPELAFHLTSIAAGIELLASVWSALASFVGHGIEPNVLDGSEARESPLGHLRALYPLLDFGALRDELSAAIAAYRDRKRTQLTHAAAGYKAKRSASDAPMLPFVDYAELREHARRILAEIIRRQDRLSLDEDWFELGQFSTLVRPFTWNTFWQVGQEVGVSPHVRSVVMDAAIDSAILKTTHTVSYHNGQQCLVRGFEPDSEFAHEALERMAFGAEEVTLNA